MYRWVLPLGPVGKKATPGPHGGRARGDALDIFVGSAPLAVRDWPILPAGQWSRLADYGDMT